MEYIIGIFILSIVIVIVATIVMGVEKFFKMGAENIAKIEREMDRKLSAINFFPAKKIMSDDMKSGIAIDESGKKICLIKQKHGSIELDVISYKDILQSVIYEDGVTITKAASGSRLGGAIVGGVIAGGVGALIGGLSGKKISSDKVNRIDLQITVNRIDNPIHDINLLNLEVKKHGSIYNSDMKKARHWHGILDILIKRADKECVTHEENTSSSNATARVNNFISEELVKLADLKNKGLLTNAEFTIQKTRLLA